MQTDEPDDNDRTESNDQQESVPPAIREHVFEESDYQCQVCGAAAGDPGITLEIHHKTPQTDGGTNDPENLTCLCDRCHRHYHRMITADDLGSDVLTEPSSRTTLSGCDCEILKELDGRKLQTSEVAAATSVSEEHCRRRLWSLMAAGFVDREFSSGKWGLPEEIESSARGRWPSSPQQAARLAVQEMMRRLSDKGWSHDDVAELAGYHPRSVRVAIDRAAALRPPLDGPDVSGEPRQPPSGFVTLEDLLDDSTPRTDSEEEDDDSSSPDLILDVLKDPLRRRVLRQLQQVQSTSRSSMVADLLTQMYATSDQDQRYDLSWGQLEASLHHQHLPKMADAGLITYGANGSIHLASTTPLVDAVLTEVGEA